MSRLRKVMGGLAGAMLLAALVWALWPAPQRVDLDRVTRGPMQGSIDAQGVTRVRAPFRIVAPITGNLSRPPVAVGDQVLAGQTVLAVIGPTDPTLMDARARAQAEAAIAEAEAALSLAETALHEAEARLDHARSELDRSRALAERGIIPRLTFDDIVAAHDAALRARDAALAQLDLNRATLLRAQAQLLGPASPRDPVALPGRCCVTILAPQDGIVLDLPDRNARLVQAGEALLTIGDLNEMEIEIDLLSNDAVRVPAGALAVVERWGGPGVLQARLRRVEPAAFTRVSALGIEEQRVRLWLDLLHPAAERPGLGDGFRVYLRLILWEAKDLLRVPQPALFRQGDAWAVFVVDKGRARLRRVQIGRVAGGQAEVLNGLVADEVVVLYPANTLQDGDAIAAR